MRPFFLGTAGLIALAEVADAVEEDREHDGATDEGTLPEGIDAKQPEAVADHLDQSRTHDRPEGRADAGRGGGVAVRHRPRHAGAEEVSPRSWT